MKGGRNNYDDDRYDRGGRNNNNSFDDRGRNNNYDDRGGNGYNNNNNGPRGGNNNGGYTDRDNFNNNDNRNNFNNRNNDDFNRHNSFTKTNGPANNNNNNNAARVVKTQPLNDDVWQYEHEWIHGLCECCSSYKRCCCAFLCFPCFTCQLMTRTGECCCQGFIPFSLMALRAKLRTGFRIKGSLCNDCCATTFCPVCAAIQMDSELDDQEL